ncbi:MAG: hypothetical protein R2932_39870 [Caldilineaceae bacterium]
MEHTILKTEALKAYYVLDLYGKAKVVKAVNEVDLDIEGKEDLRNCWRERLTASRRF